MFIWNNSFCLLSSARVPDQKEAIEQVRHVFVSRQNGKDTDTCGLDTKPCKTLAKAFSKASSDLRLHIDGTGTAYDPYDCLGMQAKAIVVHTKVVLEGFSMSPRIYCKFGINFVSPKGLGMVALSNLVLIGTPLGFVELSVTIYNCTIRDVLGSRTWAIAAGYRIRQVETITIKETIFRNNSACLVVVAEGQSNISQLNLAIRNTTFTYIQRNSVTALLTSSKNFRLNVDCDGIVFTKNTGRFLYPTLEKTLGGKLTIRAVIRNSVFSENAVSAADYLVLLCRDATSFCTLRVINTTFTSNTGGGILCRAIYLSFQNMTMNLTLGTAVTIYPKGNANIIIKDSIFARNIISISILDDWQVLYTYSKISLWIQDSLFYGYHPAHASHNSGTILVLLQQVKLSAPSQWNVVFDGITIEDTVGTPVLVSLGERIKGADVVIEVTRSLFLYNGRSADQPFSHPICSFFAMDTSLDSTIVFEKTRFEENFAAHGIVFSSLKTTLKNCYFGKNLVFSQGGDLVVRDSPVTIQNTNFLKSKKGFDFKSLAAITGSFISCLIISEIIITNSSFITDNLVETYPVVSLSSFKSLQSDDLTSIQCPVGTELHKVYEEKSKQHHSLTLSCKNCVPRTYSLVRGRSKGLSVVTQSSCLACPYGATCYGNTDIKAETSFWGYIAFTDPLTLQFIPCPHNYCHQSHNHSLSNYNSCYGNRGGVLCGHCVDGYTEDLFTTRCRDIKQCQDYWFWPVTIAYVVIMAVYLVFKPPVISILGKKILWFLNQNDNPAEHHSGGYIKIVFYFYQAAELLLISSTQEPFERAGFVNPVVALFNFETRFLSSSMGCPFAGLTAVTKELFLTLEVIATGFCLLPLYMIHRLVNKTRLRASPSPFLYLAVAIETLLLGYERLTETSLKLLHCKPIGNTWRLFYDGNIQCLQAWQGFFIGYVALFAVPFIFVVYWASQKLQKNCISFKEFLASCFLPTPFLIYWSVQHFKQADPVYHPPEDTKEIKEIFHESFRLPQPENDESGTVYWESILIGRRFVLLCFHGFISNPMLRLFCLSCTCLLILVHHVTTKPYRSSNMNTCESISLLILVIISIINLMEASFVSAAVEPIGPNDDYFNVLQWAQVVILGFLPAIVCILAIIAIVSQGIRLVIVLAGKIRSCLCCSKNEEGDIVIVADNNSDTELHGQFDHSNDMYT